MKKLYKIRLCFAFSVFMAFTIISCESDKRNVDYNDVIINESASEIQSVKAKSEVKSSLVKNEILSDKDIVKEKKAKKESAKKIEVAIRNESKLKDLTCSEIVSQYKKAVSLLKLDFKDKKGIDILKTIKNDPNFKDCRKQVDYKKELKAIDKEYYSIGK